MIEFFRKNDRLFPKEKKREKVENSREFPKGRKTYIYYIYTWSISLTVNGGKEGGR